jgi:hypothetical protein
MPSENRFNAVAIIDSIPEGELNTARRLRDDLRDIAYEFSPIPRVEYHRVESVKDFARTIEGIRLRIASDGIYPLVHIEAHGYEDGLELACGEKMSWAQTKDALISLNVAMRLNLMLVLAACHGGTFIKAIRLADRAPVWGLIGPMEELSVAQVQVDFGAFYKTLFKTLSPSEALKALNSNAPSKLYYRMTAEGLFYKVWRSYKEKYCTEEQLRTRAGKMYRTAKAEGTNPMPSVGHLKRILVSAEPASFNKFRDMYFMHDLYPEHATRFAVTYESAESHDDR